MAPSPVLGPATTTTTTPTFRKKRPTLYRTPVHPHAQYHHHHHQHYSRPRSRNTHTRYGHGASPTPVFPVHRPSSHHDALLIGPVSRSARRCQWAHSAHLYEVRRIHHSHYHHHHCSSSSSSSSTVSCGNRYCRRRWCKGNCTTTEVTCRNGVLITALQSDLISDLQRQISLSSSLPRS
jgi:hypothetical protein